MFEFSYSLLQNRYCLAPNDSGLRSGDNSLSRSEPLPTLFLNQSPPVKMARLTCITIPALAAVVIFAAVVRAECTRESLLAAAAGYVEAQSRGVVDGLPLSTDNFTYMLNNEAAEITGGPLVQALPIDLNRTTADTVACASYTLIISASGETPYVIGTQLQHGDGEGADTDTSTITLIDAIAATTGDLFFNAQQTLEYVAAEDWGTLPDDGNRPSREELRRVGDAYLDMWTDATAADSIPWGTDCERVEGSMLTRPCGSTLPRGGSATRNGNRRYVIDETFGSVNVLCSFDALGSLPDSHEVRIEGGKVKYVHTVTIL